MVVEGVVRVEARPEVEPVPAPVAVGARAAAEVVVVGVVLGRLVRERTVPVRRVQRLDRARLKGPGALAEAGAEAGTQLGRVRQAGERVVRGAVGELELAALAFLYVLDVREQEAGPSAASATTELRSETQT